MSETTEPGEKESGEPARETSLGVLGVAFGLLIVAGIFGWVSTQKTKAIDGREVLVELFGVEALPLGLQVEEGARGAQGERIVRLVNPDAPADPEPLPEEEPSRQEGADEHDEQDEEGDGDGHEGEAEPKEAAPPSAKKPEKKPEGEKDTAPREVVLVTYPESVAVRELERLFSGAISFGGMQGQDGGGGGEQRGGGRGDGMQNGGRLLMSSGTLKWKDLDARYFHQRDFKDRRGYRDFVRVNLSQPGRYVVLFASWPIQYPGAPSRIEEILDALEPLALDR